MMSYANSKNVPRTDFSGAAIQIFNTDYNEDKQTNLILLSKELLQKYIMSWITQLKSRNHNSWN